MSDADIGPLALSPKKAAVALDCGLTRIYLLMNSGELESYLDGGSRKITTESIRRYQAECIAATNSGKTPARQDRIAAATTASIAARQSAPRRRGRPAKVRPASMGAR